MAGRLVGLLTDRVGTGVDVVALFAPERRQSPLIRALLDAMDSFASELAESLVRP